MYDYKHTLQVSNLPTALVLRWYSQLKGTISLTDYTKNLIFQFVR